MPIPDGTVPKRNEWQKEPPSLSFVKAKATKQEVMEGMISVREALTKHPELETIMGYSEGQLEDLIQNGEVIGRIDHTTGEVFMDKEHLKDLVVICNDHEHELSLPTDLEEEWEDDTNEYE